MSGVTPFHISRFRDLLGTRGHDMAKLTADVGICRRHLSEIVWGRWQGYNYMARIRACVTAAEWAELLHGENFATWNKAQLARGEAEPVWLMRSVCAWCGTFQKFVPCCRAQAGAVTHGLCPACYAREMSALEHLGARQVARDVTADSFPSAADAAPTAAPASGLGGSGGGIVFSDRTSRPVSPETR